MMVNCVCREDGTATTHRKTSVQRTSDPGPHRVRGKSDPVRGSTHKHALHGRLQTMEKQQTSVCGSPWSDGDDRRVRQVRDARRHVLQQLRRPLGHGAFTASGGLPAEAVPVGRDTC